MNCMSIFLLFLPYLSLSSISCRKQMDLLRILASPSSSISMRYWSDFATYLVYSCQLRRVLTRQRQTASSWLSLVLLPQRVMNSSSNWQSTIYIGSLSFYYSYNSRSLFMLALQPWFRLLMYYTISDCVVVSISLSSCPSQFYWQSPRRMVSVLRLNFIALTDFFMFWMIQLTVGLVQSEIYFQMVSGSVPLSAAIDLQQQQMISNCSSGLGTHSDPTMSPRICLETSLTLSSACLSMLRMKKPNLSE